MRSFLLLAVLVLALGVGVLQVNRTQGDGLVAGLVAASRVAGPAPDPAPASPPEAGPEIAAPAEEARSERRPTLVEAGALSVLEPADPASAMVRYTDAAGSIHMVRNLSLVPPAYRDSAVRLGGRGVVNQVEIPTRTTTAFLDWKPDANPNRGGVLLYSAQWCGACKRAKRYLDGAGIGYQEIDIDRDPEARDELRRVVGRVAIPLLSVDGNYVSGFRRNVYARVLGLRD